MPNKNYLVEMHSKIQKAKKCDKCKNCLIKTSIGNIQKKICMERFNKMLTMDFGVRNCKYYKEEEHQHV